MGFAYARGLPAALERGLVAMAAIDAAVRRMLELKARLGLFDDPYRRGAGPGLTPAQQAGHRALAREAARRSIVLLTNRDGLLPLAAGGRLAVLGPLADAPAEMLGPWSMAGRPEDMVPLLAGLRAGLPASEIGYARGVAIEADAPADLAGRARTRGRRRRRRALPRRGRAHERRGREPGAPGSARPPARARRSGAGPRQAGGRAARPRAGR